MMRSNHKNWSIDKLTRRRQRNKIDPKPPYQRGPVWNDAKKQLLIDTILRDYDVPKIYLRNLPEGSSFEHEVADGQQRLRTIWEFWDDKFPISKDSAPFANLGDLRDKTFSKLPSDAQDAFCDYEFAIVEIVDASDLEIRDLFLRLQNGVSLNPAEKRNAMIGGMRDFISKLSSDPHKVLPLTKIKPNRFGWDDLLAHVVCLEIATGPTDIKAVNLKKMYETEGDFRSDSTVAKKIKRVLNFMAKILKDEPPEMDIKWGFIDLYLAISRLDLDYSIKGHEENFLSFYLSIENERRNVSDPAELLENKDPWDKDLYRYITAFVKDGSKKKNIEIRHKAYIKRILRDLPTLVSKDPKRPFTNDQRVVIWRRDQGVCQHCKKKIKFANMHADHIKPHSKGGKTIIDNAQTLCKACNLAKGAK